VSLFSNTTALLGKELRTEFRSRELLTTTVVFILVVVVLFSFTFDASSAESRRFAASLLWLAFLFAASLMLQPCFLREQSNDTLSALRLSVTDPFAIFAAKLSANTLFLLIQRAGVSGFRRARGGSFSGEPRSLHRGHGAFGDFGASAHARAPVTPIVAALAHSGPCGEYEGYPRSARHGTLHGVEGYWISGCF